MTDWLTPEERAELMPHPGLSKSVTPQGCLAAVIERFAAHAAEADRRLAECDDVINELAGALRASDEPWRREPALARVDAMGGDDADA